MAKRHKNKGHKAHSHGRGLSKTRGSSSGRGRRGGGGRGGHGIDSSHEFPDLMDLSIGGYVPETSSMKLGGTRPGRMADEVYYTNQHQGETMKRQLRKNPILFVKAKEVYDPSADLYKKMAEKIKARELEEGELVIREPHEELSVVAEMRETDIINHDEELISEDTGTASEASSETEDSLSDEELFFVDKTGDEAQADDSVELKFEDLPSKKEPEPSIIHEVEVEQEEPVGAQESKQEDALEFDQSFSIGKVFLNSERQPDGSLHATLPKISKYQAAQNYISQVMSANRMHDADDDDEEDDINTSEEEFIMKAMDSEDEEADTNVSEIEKLSLKDDKEKVPDYGFVEEDYQFDISTISITNVRFGAGVKQFYARSPQVLGAEEYIWIDGDDLAEFLVDNGMASHRVEVYYNYVMNELGLLDEVEEESEPEFDISDTSDEEDDEDEDEDEDGMGTLLEYAKNGKIFGGSGTNNDDEFSVPTESVKTKGKSSNRRLDLDHLDDLALIESLQDQYIAHKRSRKEKRQAAAQKAVEVDLSLKYEYTMHIRDIRDEFDQFLHDGNRSALTFPPLDHHGLKTIRKLAGFYNMKSRNFGTGLKRHVVVIKNKRTFHSLPSYQAIGVVMQQRPIFNRTDVKRSKDEVANSKDGAKTRQGLKSKAHSKEGDIVGHKAPEIGQENIGRRLLEKLGWSKGEGLGIDSKGISEPIVAKIKTTKVGIK